MAVGRTERRLLLFPAFFLVLAILSTSCVNDLESIKKISFRPDDPDEKTSELYLTYTDSGYAKVRLYAKLAESYTQPEKVVKFKDGVRVEFYNEDGSLESILTALYGEIREEEGTMMVRDSVQLFNVDKDRRLETEELYWKRSDSTIYTDKMVMIRTPESLIFGKGIRTRQDFSHYDFYQPHGKVDIDDKK